MKLYSTQGSPPSLAVSLLLKYLDIPYEKIDIDFGAGEHLTEEHAKRNPQKEVPVIDDDGFYLSESNAIMQYICDKYKPDSNVYPKDIQLRAIVNHRLCFDATTYYRHILDHLIPLYYDYEPSPLSMKKIKLGVELFNTYLERTGKKYVAADHLTIADLQLATSTMCLESIDFDLSPYSLVSKWYNTFNMENPELRKLVVEDLKVFREVVENPPDLSHINHHIHPIRQNNK